MYNGKARRIFSDRGDIGSNPALPCGKNFYMRNFLIFIEYLASKHIKL
jgi:hypothetical protein